MDFVCGLVRMHILSLELVTPEIHSAFPRAEKGKVSHDLEEPGKIRNQIMKS